MRFRILVSLVVLSLSSSAFAEDLDDLLEEQPVPKKELSRKGKKVPRQDVLEAMEFDNAFLKQLYDDVRSRKKPTTSELDWIKLFKLASKVLVAS